jgi:hypothetical protein
VGTGGQRLERVRDRLRLDPPPRQVVRPLRRTGLQRRGHPFAKRPTEPRPFDGARELPLRRLEPQRGIAGHAGHLAEPLDGRPCSGLQIEGPSVSVGRARRVLEKIEPDFPEPPPPLGPHAGRCGTDGELLEEKCQLRPLALRAEHALEPLHHIGGVGVLGDGASVRPLRPRCVVELLAEASRLGEKSRSFSRARSERHSPLEHVDPFGVFLDGGEAAVERGEGARIVGLRLEVMAKPADRAAGAPVLLVQRRELEDQIRPRPLELEEPLQRIDPVGGSSRLAEHPRAERVQRRVVRGHFEGAVRPADGGIGTAGRLELDLRGPQCEAGPLRVPLAELPERETDLVDAAPVRALLLEGEQPVERPDA